MRLQVTRSSKLISRCCNGAPFSAQALPRTLPGHSPSPLVGNSGREARARQKSPLPDTRGIASPRREVPPRSGGARQGWFARKLRVTHLSPHTGCRHLPHTPFPGSHAALAHTPPTGMKPPSKASYPPKGMKLQFHGFVWVWLFFSPQKNSQVHLFQNSQVHLWQSQHN